MFGLSALLEKWKNNDPVDTTNLRKLALSLLDTAEKRVTGKEPDKPEKAIWLEYLSLTKKPVYLHALGSNALRNRWAETVFKILRLTNYSLCDLMDQHTKEHPLKNLFIDLSGPVAVEWSYELIHRHIREIATVIYQSAGEEPRVALFTENCLEGACTDLACLCYQIFITPLSTHFHHEILLHIFDTLSISVAVADSRERIALLEKLQQQTKRKFRIFSLLPGVTRNTEILYLPEECKKISGNDMETILASKTNARTEQVATTMFTSGSTGLPKGVSFSVYNIVSKRFARAAALPFVGDEVFLCYLPLFHTFGRYLEMTGAIFWNGTYIFAGNTSAETLFSLFPKVNPTGFISIPLRWQELYERCQEKTSRIESPELKTKCVREIVGGRLKWGLSAAGYLDPMVFRFFNQFGIHLCSGFGMTEATGGITMTPPGKYKDSTVGIPLPGVLTRLTADSELELSGHYIARYLEDAGPGDVIPYHGSGKQDKWLSTGDVFRISRDGYYQIVDRVKDIYKNNRGQTVAPQIIEKKFHHVPGIKNSFLVGDNRPYNVLLIVPDKEDPIFKSIKGDNLTEYFHQIVMAANADVAPYERVVNFTLLDRDFNHEKSEITPKGSFNRKQIEHNFREVIEHLYISNIITIEVPGLTLIIPRWFFRDLGILETDISLRDKHLVNRQSRKELIFHLSGENHVRIGDLIYTIDTGVIDLGIFARQPLLWAGNPELIGFCPIKEGWDVPFPGVTTRIRTTLDPKVKNATVLPLLKSIRNQDLIRINDLICKALFLDSRESEKAARDLGQLFSSAEPRLANLIRHRLEALAFHPEMEIRALAYRILLLKAPDPDQIQYMPTFIESGLPFLNEKSIKEIAASNFGKHRLDALKQRLYWYRTHLNWPATRKNQHQFSTLLHLLFDFAAQHLEYYVSVRSELSRWILHKKDPYLSKKAETYFYKLAKVFERSMDERFSRLTVQYLKSKIVFENGVPERERERILQIFLTSTFLQESVVLTFNEHHFEVKDIPPKGIWILRLQAYKEFKHYRLSINTISGKHFDLHMVMSDNPDFIPKPDTFYWLASLAGFPYGPAVVPFLGSSRPDLGILSSQYIGGLTVWEKIREYSEIHKTAGYMKPNAWRKVFIKAFTVIFRAWHHSGFQIVPGNVSPSNVAVAEMDFIESAIILSVTGWTKYRNTLSLVGPMLQEFYSRTVALYPWCKKQLDVSWIFDACIEALGKEDAMVFLKNLLGDLSSIQVAGSDNDELTTGLKAYLKEHEKKQYLPLAVFNAIDQYREWYRMNPDTSPHAREQTLIEFIELYKLQEFPELIRYYFYRHSYFSNASKKISVTFDRLLEKMQLAPGVLPLQMLDLSDLQSAIHDPMDKNVFSRMVFPRLQSDQKIDFLRVGENLQSHVVVRFDIQDKTGMKYIQREPIEPREIGQLYQLFFRENYPKEIADADHHFVVIDNQERIIGGLTWRYLENNNVLLDGIVVSSALQGKGIASAMIGNFFTNMAARGVNIIKAHFLFGNYYLKHFFEVDKKWGALIKTLNEN